MLMYTVVTSYQYTSAAHRDTVPSFLNALRRYLASSPKRLWCFYHFCIYVKNKGISHILFEKLKKDDMMLAFENNMKLVEYLRSALLSALNHDN